MKGDARRLAQVLRSLATLRVVCLFGDDSELIAAAAREIVVTAAGSIDDPFRVTVSLDSHPDAIDVALSSPPLAGGRSVVWARQGSERLGTVVAQTLATTSGALLVLEFAGASKTSKVRRAVEGSEHGCALACYGSAEAMRAEIRTRLHQGGRAIEEDWAGHLAAWAAATQRSAGQVADMLTLYVGSGRQADSDAIRAVAGDTASSGSSVGLGPALDRALSGDQSGLDAAVEETLAESAAIGTGRASLAHVQRLRTLAVQRSLGRTLSEAGRSVRPPVFASEEAAIAAVLRRRTAEQLSALAGALWRAERLCKRNGVPAEAVVRSTLLRAS